MNRWVGLQLGTFRETIAKVYGSCLRIVTPLVLRTTPSVVL